MLQFHALALELVERRRVELFVAMTTQITPAHVIGEDEEDVGRSYGCGLAHGIHGQHGKDEGNEEDAESFHEACIP
jgi:hypothetical protein